MSNLLSAFNDHFSSFVEDIQQLFPEDVDLMTAKNSFIAIRKINPKLIITIWKTHIVDVYQNQIISGNLHFFIDKDYSGDVQSSSNSDKILQAINRLRDPVKKMDKLNQDKVMKYIQNLTQLCNLYLKNN